MEIKKLRRNELSVDGTMVSGLRVETRSIKNLPVFFLKNFKIRLLKFSIQSVRRCSETIET